jgi:N-acetylglucosamine-6-sulfatase
MTGPDLPWTVPVVTEGLIKRLDVTLGGFGVPQGLTTSGIRTGRYKLIRYSTGEGELYDLMRDPLELTSHFGDPEYATIQAQLESLWASYRSCETEACRVEMPAGLQTTPEWLATQFRRAQARHRAYYGS